MSAVGTLEVGYESNVEGQYPEEQDPDLQPDDFYWMPGLSIQSKSVYMRPSTTINLSAAAAYQDYFTRNDLDTELYRVALDFQTVHPRLTLAGTASTEFTVESEIDKYRPGGASRDPHTIDTVILSAEWNYRRLKLSGSAGNTSERHDYERDKPDDNDETILNAGAFLDLYSYLSPYITWEKTITVYTYNDTEEDDTTIELGFSGGIPIELLRRPKITYSFGISYEEVTEEDGSTTKTWEPVHTITVQDQYQISKTVLFAASATWENTEEDDEVTFQYDLRLSQLIGARAQHEVYFTQEPARTFGATDDSKTTTYGYNFGVKDLIFYNLGMNFGLSYEEDTPLGVADAQTEEITTLVWGLAHTRQLTRRLARVLAYDYNWESSNFHDEGAMEEHRLVYSLRYDF